MSEAPGPQAEAEALKREAVTAAKQVVETYPNDALSYVHAVGAIRGGDALP
ncbi:MAG: hypothetical protein KJ072_02305 [Verrucomicrobia bacterium]|nr:hypothetical protein [Verrucomicrobiota bacterium]